MDIEKEVAEIVERNKRVELDKAWEISWARRFTISVITYICVVLYLSIIHAPNALATAIIPVVGYILSTLSLGYVKKLWITFGNPDVSRETSHIDEHKL
jgi:polyferredoxin